MVQKWVPYSSMRTLKLPCPKPWLRLRNDLLAEPSPSDEHDAEFKVAEGTGQILSGAQAMSPLVLASYTVGNRAKEAE